MSELILVATVVLPIGWLISEFTDKRAVRIVLGVLAIGLSFFVALVVGSLRDLQCNIYFGDASKKLVETTIAGLDAGDPDVVRERLKELNTNYNPTYEWRANYKELVDQYAASLANESN